MIPTHTNRWRPQDSLGGVGNFIVRIVIRVNIDELHHKVGISAGRGHTQPGRNGPGNSDIFCQRFALIDHYIGTSRGESLIVDHIALRDTGGHVIYEWHWMGRIAYVFVPAFVFNRRIERQFAAGVEIECFGVRVRRRPLLILAPNVRAGLEHVCLRKNRAFAFEIVFKERELNIGTKEI